MGLLDRARTVEKQGSDQTGEDIVEKARRLVDGLLEDTSRIDLPGDAFRGFRNLLKFEKGMLLLPDDGNREYYPWISLGFDRTTSRRLRIPYDLADSDGDATRFVVPLEESELTPMLSTREAGMLNYVTVFRIGTNPVPSALILTEGRWTEDAQSATSQAIRIFLQGLGNGIDESRSLMDRLDSAESSGFDEWIAAWADRPGLFVIVDASLVIDILVDRIEGLELYRARRDVVDLLRHVTGRMGRLYDLKDGRVAMLFPPERLPDRDLYLHQLSQALLSAFGVLNEAPEVPAEFLNWPEERDSVAERLPGHLPVS